MNLAESKATAVYQEALQSTAAGWEDLGIGFTDKGIISTTTLSRQLNSLLFLVVKQNQQISTISEESTQLHNRVKNLEGKTGTSASPLYKSEIESINDKLKRIQEVQRSLPPKETPSGVIKVFEDPYHILRRL
ncbi:ORFII [Banana streak virus Acuminata Yunnan]|uniref:ORFII n=1 Tax=Banana streak virus Acuminata Yunnan TaxID=334778 RepID=UPI0000552CF9|nr:ORFII [Banana streak virus Acuminata Yunnan]AAY99426.1 ORFII [Banana streak virus Acuminata Yunnan]